ncbi:response regulator transcription factor [Legionella rowbothamii]|uniref:response regulator transcription factor n=1 Tax=Legionella rowbothamii TaxID=96229 RepID=UPI001055DEAA|nr:response regulator [Legionella rowbothamii]
MKDTKICIIDDNQNVCDSLKFLIQTFYKLDVETYNNPLQFLERFSPTWQGCLIIDLFMPSLSGMELMKKLKKINNNLYIIIISGHGTPAVANECLKLGAYAFINKPLKIDDLLCKITSITQLIEA